MQHFFGSLGPRMWIRIRINLALISLERYGQTISMIWLVATLHLCELSGIWTISVMFYQFEKCLSCNPFVYPKMPCVAGMKDFQARGRTSWPPESTFSSSKRNFFFFFLLRSWLPATSITANSIESRSNPYPHPQRWVASYCSSDRVFLSSVWRKGRWRGWRSSASPWTVSPTAKSYLRSTRRCNSMRISGRCMP